MAERGLIPTKNKERQEKKKRRPNKKTRHSLSLLSADSTWRHYSCVNKIKKNTHIGKKLIWIDNFQLTIKILLQNFQRISNYYLIYEYNDNINGFKNVFK